MLQTIAPYKENIAIGLCLGLGVIATVACLKCLLLPVETKGRALRLSVLIIYWFTVYVSFHRTQGDNT